MVETPMQLSEKWKAINTLAPARVLYRPDKTYYIDHRGVEIKKGGFLASPNQSGGTPEEAVEECWHQYVTGSPVVVINAMTDTRREVRWNPFAMEWRPAGERIDATHLLGL